ncbi:hypothetical protein SDC9_117470 [bioreactor metagenome]|uniref:Uncharacterized protein n=1 Tax=bioreactor metagenome TaxID=1076179 RepID=A0A645BZ39_9ZZZZ
MFIGADRFGCPVSIIDRDFPQDAQPIAELRAAAVDADAATVPPIGQGHRPDVPFLQQPGYLIFLHLQILVICGVIRCEQCIRHITAVDFG